MIASSIYTYLFPADMGSMKTDRTIYTDERKRKNSHSQNLMYLGNIVDQTPIKLILGFAIVLATGISSCGNITNSGMNAIGANVTSIKDLTPSTTPNQDNSKVYIQGKVDKHVPLVKKHAYQLNDSTGKIWVLTPQSNLKVGQQVVIKGKLRYQDINLGGQDFGEVYLEEQ